MGRPLMSLGMKYIDMFAFGNCHQFFKFRLLINFGKWNIVNCSHVNFVMVKHFNQTSLKDIFF